MGGSRDVIDELRDRWRVVRPDLDTSSIDVIGRALRCAELLRRRLDAVLAEEGLNRAEFDLLAALRRSDSAVTPGELTTVMLASHAATTKRIQQLSARGLTQRHTDTHDRRSARVALTEKGRETLDRAMEHNLRAERELLADLDADTRTQLVNSLAAFNATLETEADGQH